MERERLHRVFAGVVKSEELGGFFEHFFNFLNALGDRESFALLASMLRRKRPVTINQLVVSSDLDIDELTTRKRLDILVHAHLVEHHRTKDNYSVTPLALAAVETVYVSFYEGYCKIVPR